MEPLPSVTLPVEEGEQPRFASDQFGRLLTDIGVRRQTLAQHGDVEAVRDVPAAREPSHDPEHLQRVCATHERGRVGLGEHRHEALHGGARLSTKNPKNIAASVRGRLLHLAKERGD